MSRSSGAARSRSRATLSCVRCRGPPRRPARPRRSGSARCGASTRPAEATGQGRPRHGCGCRCGQGSGVRGWLPYRWRRKTVPKVSLRARKRRTRVASLPVATKNGPESVGAGKEASGSGRFLSGSDFLGVLGSYEGWRRRWRCRCGQGSGQFGWLPCWWRRKMASKVSLRARKRLVRVASLLVATRDEPGSTARGDAAARPGGSLRGRGRRALGGGAGWATRVRRRGAET